MPLSPEALLRKDKSTASERPSLEHRHFAVIADTIRMMMPMSTRTVVAQHFAKHFLAHNKKFDAMRFLRACGIFK
jgi:hypothetical protein